MHDLLWCIILIKSLLFVLLLYLYNLSYNFCDCVLDCYMLHAY